MMSVIPERKFQFTWKIENFSFCPIPENRCFDSPSFVVDIMNRRTMKLLLYPRGFENNGKLFCVVKIGGIDEEGRPVSWDSVSIGSSFLIKCSEGCNFKTEIFEHHAVNGGSELYPVIEEMFKRKNVYLPNDALTIQYQASITDFNMPLPETNPGNKNILSDQMSAAGCKPEVFDKHFNSNECSAVTHIGINKKYFTWPIKGIQALGLNHRVSIPVLYSIVDNPSLALTFYFADEDEIDPSVKFEIRRMEFGKCLFVKCKISALNSENSVTFLKKGVYLFHPDKKNECWSFPFQMHRSELLNCLDSTNDVLYLRCEFAYSLRSDMKHAETEDGVPLHFGISTNISSIDDSLKDLYVTDRLPDLTLRVGNRSFKAHKNILSIHSSVFRDMFENDMKEKTSGFVDIPDVNPDTFDQMLIFLHKNEINIANPNEAINLYTAADKYQLLPLKRRCSLFLQSVLSVSNVCSVLNLADLHQDDNLMNAAKEFVFAIKNEVFVSKKWKKFMEINTKLCARIMFQALTGEENLFQK